MAFWQKNFSKSEPRSRLIPLYNAIIAVARQPDWYTQGDVPDTLDGRFDMLVAVFSLVLFRLESLGAEAAKEMALLTEVFVEDMDGQLRESGIDYTVGKHIGKMMAALGGRLSAYRESRHNAADYGVALVRNLYRQNQPTAVALQFTTRQLQTLDGVISQTPLPTLLAGQLG